MLWPLLLLVILYQVNNFLVVYICVHHYDIIITVSVQTVKHFFSCKLQHVFFMLLFSIVGLNLRLPLLSTPRPWNYPCFLWLRKENINNLFNQYFKILWIWNNAKRVARYYINLVQDLAIGTWLEYCQFSSAKLVAFIITVNVR